MSQLTAALHAMPRPLAWGALGHAALAALCLLALAIPAASITGVHPALKPLKFGVSIALLLGALGVLVPMLNAPAALRRALAWLFTSTMVVEMALIVAQALRGTTSHFNLDGAGNAAVWRVMIIAIVVASLGMLAVLALACARPLLGNDGRPLPSLATWAWRFGLLLLALSPVSGFAMGGRLQHSVGGADGGPGLPLLGWSVQHGDLRVSHFVALHALQLLPLAAWLATRWLAAPWLRWLVVLALSAAAIALCVGTLVQALAGQPVLRRAAALSDLSERARGGGERVLAAGGDQPRGARDHPGAQRLRRGG